MSRSAVLPLVGRVRGGTWKSVPSHFPPGLPPLQMTFKGCFPVVFGIRPSSMNPHRLGVSPRPGAQDYLKRRRARGGRVAVAVCAPRSCSAGQAGLTSVLRQGAHGGCAGERWGKARVSVAGPVRGPLGPWQCSRGVPCLRVLRFTIWVAQLCCRVRVGVRRPGRGSWRAGQACTLPCVHFHVCVSGNPCGGRPSTCWTRDAAGCLQLARRPPHARRPVPAAPAPGLASSPQIGPAYRAELGPCGPPSSAFMRHREND